METNHQHSKNYHSMFEVMTANQVLRDAASLPDPIELLSPLIIQGKLIILFAGNQEKVKVWCSDTSVGLYKYQAG